MPARTDQNKVVGRARPHTPFAEEPQARNPLSRFSVENGETTPRPVVKFHARFRLSQEDLRWRILREVP